MQSTLEFNANFFQGIRIYVACCKFWDGDGINIYGDRRGWNLRCAGMSGDGSESGLGWVGMETKSAGTGGDG